MGNERWGQTLYHARPMAVILVFRSYLRQVTKLDRYVLEQKNSVISGKGHSADDRHQAAPPGF